MTSRHRVLITLAVLIFVLAVPGAAWAGWDIAQDSSSESFHAFNQRFSGDVYDYPRHSAAPLGLLGFDIYAGASLDRGFGNSVAGDLIHGDLTGGAMTIGRVGVRKGLPGGIDIGVAYSRPLGSSDLNLASADVQWAILQGGPLSPAVSLRATGTGTVGSVGTYEFRQYGAEILVSKGFTILTPYAGVGVFHSRGTLNAIHGPTLHDNDSQGIVYAGVSLSLLLPKITFEVEKADVVQASLRVGVGL